MLKNAPLSQKTVLGRVDKRAFLCYIYSSFGQSAHEIRTGLSRSDPPTIIPSGRRKHTMNKTNRFWLVLATVTTLAITGCGLEETGGTGDGTDGMNGDAADQQDPGSDQAPDAGAGGTDTGTTAPADGGGAPSTGDAGGAPDAGAPAPDAGSPTPDAGTPTPDAGSPTPDA